MSYVTVSDIKSRISNPDDYTDEQVKTAITLAQQQIDNFMEKENFFSVHNLEITEEANGGSRLYITHTSLPLLEITEIKINDVPVDSSLFSYDMCCHSLQYSNGFCAGDEVKIKGEWGFSSVPLLVKESCIRLTIMILKDEEVKEGVGTEQIERVSSEGSTITFSSTPSYTASTGDKWVDSVLQIFKRRVVYMGKI
ncbi:hypothetical protein J7M23_09620 [Candidatus Sumerlaeota bacterium]|nr:hypothetical protein [Candidatus Sumerlaeota bacterium]